MGVQSQKKNLMNDPQSGDSPKRAARKLRRVLAEKNPDVGFTELNNTFRTTHGITLLSICEIWHQFRTRTRTIDAMADAFASKLALLSQDKRRLEQIIVAQRAELAKRSHGLPRSALEAEVRQQREHSGLGIMALPLGRRMDNDETK